MNIKRLQCQSRFLEKEYKNTAILPDLKNVPVFFTNERVI